MLDIFFPPSGGWAPWAAGDGGVWAPEQEMNKLPGVSRHMEGVGFAQHQR